MGDGGVSAAFPYLNHKIPDPVKPVYVEGPKPLTFNELYSPRDESVFSPINSQDKSFWRTRDTISFSIYELRCKNLMLVTCRDSSNSTNVYRTIALDLAKLYFEVESKARGSRDLLVRKKEKALPDDAALHKAAASYILARLNIGAEPLPWPESFALSTDAALPTDELASLPTESPPVHKEKMVTFSFLSGDSQVLEVPIASLQGFPLPGIDPASLKLAPAAPPAAAPFPVAAAAAPLPAAAGTADASAPVEQPTPAALSLPQLSSPPKPRAHKAKDKATSNKLPAVSPAHKGRGKG